MKCRELKFWSNRKIGYCKMAGYSVIETFPFLLFLSNCKLFCYINVMNKIMECLKQISKKICISQ